ncbi:MAG: acetyl-CoA C-acyltransferase [Deltaproteobacteria bacterium]|nr:acetyl-CoA C-acyltransferase [Deltaproteobacteria bacterium]
MSMHRVAIIGGIRTPFVKAGGAFKDYSFQNLGAHVLKSVVKRFDLKQDTIDEFIFSSVLLDPTTPNWAREILFEAGLKKNIYAHSVSNNCISGLVAITSAAERIRLGLSTCAIAGGSESMTNPSLTFGKQASKIFLELFRTRAPIERAKLVCKLRPRHLMPRPPAVTEPSTGLTMGQHMEITAKEMGIPRNVQDEIALASHKNAFAATEDNRLTAEIEPLGGVERDLLIRADTSLEKLAALKPVFDRSSQGTITAGNASALTDGASAVVLMSEEMAKKDGREILAFISDYQYAAIDPALGLLMAPAVAVPKLLARNSLTFSDFDLIEIHEAFGAQVAANIKAWEEGWSSEPGNSASKLRVGPLDRTKLNVLGGSIAIGHPFAATGGRMVTTLANELKRRCARRGLISVCAAGAMAASMTLVRD